ncbi:hypothetical protein J2X46_001685 [Nocardioides sp. BE266]|uniref:hypothetical protein n=1 Tax=Nocardioides sp. BE266 TaxID=2817725 RepID=UPI00285F4A07|nr:hypothetical protein [Nocardioides sp. BE266]MDR7252709.1 hypothetical protein [Nocardioides sp. BE266]
MPDLDHLDPALDRAFEALTRDLAHSPGPGAAAAMSTARTRRRTKVGAVALATLVVVGGGLTVPQLLLPQDGVASGGGSAPLDAAALERATEGWLDGWDLEARMSGSFTRPGCDALDATPLSTERGDTVLFIDDSSATVRISGFPDAADLGRSWDYSVGELSACDGLGTPDEVAVDGTSVLHWRVASPDDTGARTTDVWLAKDGLRTGLVEVVTPEQAAPADSVRGVAQALVAGVRDGWTESGTQQTAPRPLRASMLPEWPDVDLEGALAGWESPTKRAATTSPNLLCLHDRLNGVTTSVTGGGGSQHGLSYVVAGYDDPTGGEANVELVLDQLRACSSTEVTLETLPNGVHLATYDTGGAEPENAIWVAANGDRAGMVAVERADRPMPASARQDVADALYEILHKPWE